MTERTDILATCDPAFHPGLAALLNSLVAAGFQGVAWIAKEGALPDWAGPAERRGDLEICRPGHGLELRFFDCSIPFATRKAEVILQLWDRADDPAERLIYFDCDIVATYPWDYFTRWLDRGLALCCDPIEPEMPAAHPRRGDWEDALKAAGHVVRHQSDHYVNAGFIGAAPRDRAVIETWRDLCHAAQDSRQAETFFHGTRSDPFWIIDQDALNAAIMSAETPVSVMGVEGMGFGHISAAAMLHALGSPKPWGKSYIKGALKGIPPSAADHGFWTHAAAPFPAVSPAELKRQRTRLRWAGRLTALYRSPHTTNQG